MPLDSDALAPLQIIMLRDSLAGGVPGAHVEQVEIRFSDPADGGRIADAWAAVVAATEVMRMGFQITDEEPTGWAITRITPDERWNEPSPASWEDWLVTDRIRPLLSRGRLPWRVVWFPGDRRLVWTLHHSLLDGRSITRILRVFFECLRHQNTPEPSAVTTWNPLDNLTRVKAAGFFQQEFAGLTSNGGIHPAHVPPKSIRRLGSIAAARLDAVAKAMQVSAATLLTWTWGQAVCSISGMDAAVVEQVRCGAPQEGKTGFTMNTLPLLIGRASEDPTEQQLQKFRAHLLALREFETVAPYDLPQQVIDLANSPWASVIMTERGTLEFLAAGGAGVESITLHEWPGESLAAAAYHLPDLRLQVEGPRNAELMDLWAAELSALN